MKEIYPGELINSKNFRFEDFDENAIITITTKCYHHEN
jgi:hypothetical protein